MADVPAERPHLAPPASETGTLGWMRRNLFSSWGNGITTVVLIAAVGWLLSWFVNWAILTAVFTASKGADCYGHGACWALIHEKIRLIFFGTYPFDQQWRCFFAVVVLLAMLIASADRRMWNLRLVWIWLGGSFVTFLLMFGQIVFSSSLIFSLAI